MSSPSVSVVIPNWNGKDLLEKNLPFVVDASNNKKNKIIEIIVVDDGSKDSSVSFLKERFKNVRLVKHEVNRGFSAAVNTGVRSAKGDLVCLLNTDVIPSIKFLENIHKHFKLPSTFAVGLHEKGYGPATAQFINGYFTHSGIAEGKQTGISMWASGGSAVFRKNLWWELHGFDEELFTPFYWEDVDLGYRAWRKGYKIIWEPTAEVVHAHESVINASNFKKRYMNLIKERNELLFIWKNIHSKAFISKHKKEILSRAVSSPGYFMVIWMALRKRSLVLKRRARAEKESKISDEAVFALFAHEHRL